jgi:hypothetical protein
LIPDEKERGGDAFPNFGALVNYSGSRGYFFISDVIDLGRVRWFGGLTCDFWAENAKNKCKNEEQMQKAGPPPANPNEQTVHGGPRAAKDDG